MQTGRTGGLIGVLQGLVVVAGGESEESTFSTIEYYDPAKREWMTLKDIFAPRTYSSGVVLEDRLFTFGGCSGSDSAGLMNASSALGLSPRSF